MRTPMKLSISAPTVNLSGPLRRSAAGAYAASSGAHRIRWSPSRTMND